MNIERNASEDREYPGFDYLNESLVEAIIEGNETMTALELGFQRRNEATDDISNHLKVRSFWLHHKSRLLELDASVTYLNTDEAVIEKVQACAQQLNDRFAVTFVSDSDVYPYEKLSGDDLFREAVRSSTGMARRIILIEQDGLRSPREIMDQAALRHYGIVHAIERAAAGDDGSFGEWSNIAAGRVKRVLEVCIGTIDQDLIENIAGVAEGSHLS